eukprot:2078380-Rhodomonas_salina.5
MGKSCSEPLLRPGCEGTAGTRAQSCMRWHPRRSCCRLRVAALIWDDALVGRWRRLDPRAQAPENPEETRREVFVIARPMPKPDVGGAARRSKSLTRMEAGKCPEPRSRLAYSSWGSGSFAPDCRIR